MPEEMLIFSLLLVNVITHYFLIPKLFLEQFYLPSNGLVLIGDNLFLLGIGLDHICRHPLFIDMAISSEDR